MSANLMILETDRLRLKRLEATDAEALIALWCDPEVTQFMGGPRDPETLRGLFAEDAADPFAETYDLWPVVERAAGDVIGHCGLLDKEVEERPEIELVYVFARAAWGKGYATEIACALRDYAFETMKLPRLISLIEPENAASERVAIKVGMRLEKEIVRSDGAMRRVYAIERASGE